LYNQRRECTNEQIDIRNPNRSQSQERSERPGEQVVDLCAGAGGKTLAPIHERLVRSGARNVQVRTPKSVGDTIADLDGRMDLVLIDAPGTGAWGATRTPNGACGPARWSSARKSRRNRSTAPYRCSNRAGGSPMSPARRWMRKTARRCARSARAIRDFQLRRQCAGRARCGSAARRCSVMKDCR